MQNNNRMKYDAEKKKMTTLYRELQAFIARPDFAGPTYRR